MLAKEDIEGFGIKNDEQAKAWSNKFAEYVFSAITEKVNSYNATNGRSTVSFKIPSVTYADELSSEECIRHVELQNEYKTKLKELVDWSNSYRAKREALKQKAETPYLSKEFSKRLKAINGSSETNELKRLNKKINPETTGCYNNKHNTVTLNQNYFNATTIDFQNITHETLHGIHNQCMGGSVKISGYSEFDRLSLGDSAEEYTDARIEEFFSQINDIVLTDILSDSKEYAALKGKIEGITLSLDGMVNSAKYYEKCNDSFKSLEDELNNCYKDLAGIYKKIKGNEDYGKDLNNFESKLKKIEGEFEDKSEEYLENCVYFPILDISSRDPNYYFKSIKQTIGHYYGTLEGIKSEKCKDRDVSELNLGGIKLSLNHLTVSRKMFIGKKDDPLMIMNNQGPYIAAKLAIDENKDYIQANWPEILQMTPQEIDDKFFEPLAQNCAKKMEDAGLKEYI